MEKQRECWIDYVKSFACVLVVLGHFFQSMVTSGIVTETSLYSWFNKTIYYFHVPLFFLCSGYLYQKKSCVNSFSSWKANVLKKGVTLGIPYFVFSMVTWGTKAVFSGEVNTQNKGLLETLFVSPASPYWYLYVLFFVFMVTPTFFNKKMTVVGVLGALILKLISTYSNEMDIYIVSKIFANEIWFVLGMSMCVLDIPAVCRTNKWLGLGFIVAAVFILASALASGFNIDLWVMPLIMGLLGCSSTVLLVLNLIKTGVQWKVFDFLSKYTMPIFLMHTIFAAGFRSVLLKVGVADAVVHIVLGIGVSFAGPIAVAEIMKRVKLDILLYPGKYIKLSKK